MAPVLAIVEQIREALQNSGRSLRELARTLDVNHSQLSRFARGERGLALETLDKLADVLGIEITKKKQ